MMREKSWTALLAPLGLLIPAFTYFNYHEERAFSRRWAAEILDEPQTRKRPRWITVPQPVGGGGMGMTVAKAVWNQIQSNDHRLMRRVHRWRAPRWFRILMIVATRGGDGWLWYALGLILVVYGGEHRFAAIGAAASAPSRESSCSALSNTPAIASGLAKSSRTAGRRFCRRTNTRFPRATRSRHSPSRFRSGFSIRNCRDVC